MKIVVFGLTISSSWGNGHATLWRGLCRALAAQGHRVVFYEHDVSYYAGARDWHEIPGGELVLFPDWTTVRRRAEADVDDADVAMVTSFCPYGIEATELVLAAPSALRCFYDLDTPVTLSKLEAGQQLTYVGPEGLAGFDLVFSYTGGVALELLKTRLGARRVLPLYGHVDPDVHRPARPAPHYRCDFSYLGTWSADRQAGVETLLVEPARRAPDRRFLIAGALYPQDFPWANNIYFVRHLPPGEHPAFFSSSRLTLNVTREAMAAMGWCPSGRLFEAAACESPILSDWWDGLASFFAPGEEILVAQSTEDTLAALDRSDSELRRIAARARERVLAEHSSAHRADELLAAFAEGRRREPVSAMTEA
jgi:spore maturation protein CgeB